MNTRRLLLDLGATMAILVLAQVGRAAEPCGLEALPVDNCADSGHADCGHADNCGANDCCGPCWHLFGDFLYLRPRNAGLEYAVPMNGPVQAGQVPLQEGRTAELNPQFEPGFRVGIARAFDECSTISVAYAHYENSSSDAIAVNPPFVIRSMVVHPSSLDAAADWNSASAQQNIDFDIVDLDYRHVFLCDDRYSVNYVAGIRYSSLRQRFRSEFDSIITEHVNTDVNFDGAGIRLGLEGERYSPCRAIFLYGKASASFLGGEFRGSYLQTSSRDPVIAETTWKEARLVSILDCELGMGWTSGNGHVRASAGYMVSGWLNVVKSAEFISAVQANQYHGPDKIDGNGLVFDGFVGRLELQW
jgi:hypothetical protein